MNVLDIVWFILIVLGLAYIVENRGVLFKKKAAPKRKPILLIDMDGVIADYYGHFLRVWKLRHPGRVTLSAADQKDMYIEVNYPEEYANDIRSINTSVGFFEGMSEIEGAAETLNRILDEGKYEVFLCTTPDGDSQNHSCASEKIRWVELVLGKRWVKKVILTHDKTLVDGDFLIDDKPNIKGVVQAKWKHIIFTHAYNKHIADRPRLNNWSEWDKLSHNLLAEYNQTK